MVDFFWSRKRLLFFTVLMLSVFIFATSEWLARRHFTETDFSLGTPFSLIDHNGRVITEKAFLGSPSLLFFGFTYCPEICPTTLVDLGRLTEELGFEIPIYFVTLDPERDTPQQLADYLPYFGNRIIGITGNTDAILALAKSWGIYRKKISTSSGYTIDHTATVFMLSDSGKFQGTIAWGENDQIVKQKLERLWYK
uniref:Putative inner mitochondrial membrane protein Sco1p n=1 Tax=Uncultured marine bacterium 66A03 TaxID=331677 RepID=Q4PNG8_UNCMB|nr:putative inner mitochondrial membrane protein Sco1p [uncultured marine bacterium 66A03]